MKHLNIKRVYLSPDVGDGYRILIDRLWPRGITKEQATIDEWCKNIAPSTELRKWCGHKEENFAEFAKQYRNELNSNKGAYLFAEHIKDILTQSNVTLLYGAKNPNINHAIILSDWISNN